MKAQLRSIRKEIARLQRKSEKAQQDIEADARMRAELADATVQRLRDVLPAADDDHPLVRLAITTWIDPIAPDIELMIRGLLTPYTNDVVPASHPPTSSTVEDLEELVARSQRKSDALDADIRAGGMVRRVDAAAAIEARLMEFACRVKAGLRDLRATTDEPVAFIERSQTVVLDALTVFLAPMTLPTATTGDRRKPRRPQRKPSILKS